MKSICLRTVGLCFFGAWLLLFVLLATGCETTKANPGGATWERLEEVGIDGSKRILEKGAFTAPQDDSRGSSFSFSGPVSGMFGGQWQRKHNSVGSTWGQKALYGSGIGLIVLGGVLIGWGRHFKLGGIAGAVGVGLIVCAVVIDQFPFLIVVGFGGGLVIAGGFVGWMLWVDYKDSGTLGFRS